MKRNTYRVNPNDTYDPKKYWSEREIPNTSETENIPRENEKFIERHVDGCESVFELGPGTGRLFRLYHGKELVTLDLTSRHERALDLAARSNGILLRQHVLERPEMPFPFKSYAFDVAVASQVLIHVPFYLINHTVRELLRVSRRVLIISGKSDKWPTCQEEVGPRVHCFAHDYTTLIKSANR